MLLLHQDAELMKLMQDFYVLTGIRIALFDANGAELISYPKGEDTFCHCMRKNPDFRAKCRESDENAFEKCRQTQKLCIFKCHAGLIEASVPMIEDGTDKKNKVELVGAVLSRCREYSHGAEIEEKIKKIKYRNEKQIQAAAKILEACCEYVKLRRMVQPSGKMLIDTLESYIEAHIGEEITIEEICSELEISRTKLYEAVRPYLKGGIAAFIKHKKLEHAKQLVRTTDMTIPEIASAAGFSDYNYFLRVFKQKYGISTKQMRKEAQI